MFVLPKHQREIYKELKNLESTKISISELPANHIHSAMLISLLRRSREISMEISNSIMGIFNEHTFSDHGSSDARRGLRGLPGQRGIGFNLTTDGTYDLRNKRVHFIDTPDDHKVRRR